MSKRCEEKNCYDPCQKLYEKNSYFGYKIAACILIAGVFIIALYILSIIWVINYLKSQFFSITDSVYKNFLDLNNASQKPEEGLVVPPSPFKISKAQNSTRGSMSFASETDIEDYLTAVQNSDTRAPFNAYLNYHLCSWIQAAINNWYGLKFSYDNFQKIIHYGYKKLIWCRDPYCDIIAFRGSQTSSDTVSCIRGSQKKIRDIDGNLIPGQYHTGIIGKFYRILPVLNRYIQSDRKKALIITGHSMGGCLACLSALYLLPRLQNTTVIVKTFGMPRFSDMEGSIFMREKFLIENVINQSDIFTTFPPSVFPGKDKSYLFIACDWLLKESGRGDWI